MPNENDLAYLPIRSIPKVSGASGRKSLFFQKSAPNKLSPADIAGCKKWIALTDAERIVAVEKLRSKPGQDKAEYLLHALGGASEASALAATLKYMQGCLPDWNAGAEKMKAEGPLFGGGNPLEPVNNQCAEGPDRQDDARGVWRGKRAGS